MADVIGGFLFLHWLETDECYFFLQPLTLNIIYLFPRGCGETHTGAALSNHVLNILFPLPTSVIYLRCETSMSKWEEIFLKKNVRGDNWDVLFIS
jgi:hypothetical protein